MKPSRWILALDIGNSNLTYGLFPAESTSAKGLPDPTAVYRFQTHPKASCEDIAQQVLFLTQVQQIVLPAIRSLIVASVVPSLNGAIYECADKFLNCPALFLGAEIPSAVSILCNPPEEVGSDRLANAAAAFYLTQKPSVVVDFGTATTFDITDAKGRYLGGAIVPGPQLAALSLSHFTARLPKVEMAKPRSVIGNNTVESLRAGLYYGYIDLVDGLLKRYVAEIGKQTQIFATGGLAHQLENDSRFIQKKNIFPHLTLQGLWLSFIKAGCPQTPRWR